MKKIISFTTDGSTGRDNIVLIMKWLHEGFKFKIAHTIESTGSKFGLRCIISADCNADEKQALIDNVRGYASHALLESN